MLLKWTKTELLNKKDSKVTFDEELSFEPEAFVNNKRLRGLENVHVNGEGYYLADLDTFEVDMDVSGLMITPCAITNEDIEIPFEFDAHLEFSFVETSDVDAYVVKNDVVELIPVIFKLINLEVPLKAVSSGNVKYPQGEGWRIISEEDLKASKKDEIDPRLAKLKDFKFSDDE